MVIKITNKYLHSQSLTYIEGRAAQILENILCEKEILKYVTQCDDGPQSDDGHKNKWSSKYIVKYIGFFETLSF